jgi:heme-degrading monooxygenase HmoA
MTYFMNKTRFARIITIRAKHGRGNEFQKTFRSQVARSAVELEGMRRLYLLRPVGRNDEFVVISLWDDERAAENYAESRRNKQYEDKLASVQEGKERVRKFHVELHVVGKGALGASGRAKGPPQSARQR